MCHRCEYRTVGMSWRRWFKQALELGFKQALELVPSFLLTTTVASSRLN